MNDTATYDIFLSYANADQAFVARLLNRMQSAFKSRTQRSLRVFFDEREIATSADWQRRIHLGLQNSAFLVAILSPNYLASQWCGREWDYFVQRERDNSPKSDFTPLNLIYPVWADLRPDLKPDDSQARRRLRDAMARQHIDFTDTLPGTDKFRILTSKLIQDIWLELQLLQETHDPITVAAPKERSSQPTPTEHPLVTTQYGGASHRFVSLLAEAVNVTIVGITNEGLAGSLEQALARKRARDGDQSFWQTIRVVFLGDGLLPYVNDELTAQQSSQEEALLERRNHAASGKHAVTSFFLRANQPNRWRMYEYSYLLPFTGALFDMPDGSRIIQIITSRPRTSLSDQLFWEFEERVDKYFTETFQDIIKDSLEQNELILIGSPTEDSSGFFCRGARFRRGTMLNDANVTDWLPAVIVATWRHSGDAVLPLLQVNTQLNSTRELGKVSHVSGYINQNDYRSQSSVEHGNVFESNSMLTVPVARKAVCRELSEEVRLIDMPEPKFFTTLPFYYPDKENLFFYLFELCVPSTFTFPATAEMHPWTVSELLRVREHQVVCGVHELLGRQQLQPQQIHTAVEIATQNLLLHGHRELANELTEWRQGDRNGTNRLLSITSSLVLTTRVGKYSAGRELPLSGLAGLQYREFFSAILPLYAHIGVPMAAHEIRRLKEDDVTASAIERLARLYHDEAIMMSLPIEL